MAWKAFILCIGAAFWASAAEATPAEKTHNVTPVDGWAEIAALNPKFVIFGEDHGTEESPKFVGNLAASLAHQGKNILVAVELTAEDNPQIQDIWNGPHVEFEAKLKAFLGNRNDGVASMAMVKMITGLHALKAGGAPLSLVAFNGTKDDEQKRRLDTGDSQTGHEMAQAENIADAAKAGNYDYVLVLVGFSHARKIEQEGTGPLFKPMAMHLAAHGKLVSLYNKISGGTAWYCQLKESAFDKSADDITNNDVDCGVHPWKGDGAAPKDHPFMALGPFDANDESGAYDGYYWLGEIHGSPPANQK